MCEASVYGTKKKKILHYSRSLNGRSNSWSDSFIHDKITLRSVLSQSRVFSSSVHHSIPRAPDIRHIEPDMSRTSKWCLEDVGMNGLYVDPEDERGRCTQIISPNAGMETVTHTHESHVPVMDHVT